jgi:hypothetical protein
LVASVADLARLSDRAKTESATGLIHAVSRDGVAATGRVGLSDVCDVVVELGVEEVRLGRGGRGAARDAPEQ